MEKRNKDLMYETGKKEKIENEIGEEDILTTNEEDQHVEDEQNGDNEDPAPLNVRHGL